MTGFVVGSSSSYVGEGYVGELDASSLGALWDIQFHIAGTWITVSRDVVKSETVSYKQGFGGIGAKDLVAIIGTLSFTLDNSEANSAGLLGYYAPGHANCRTGFERDMRVRVRFTYNSNAFYAWHGRMRQIEPIAGRFGERLTHVQAVDYMGIASEAQLTQLTIRENKRFDELAAYAVAAIGTQPINTAYSVDPSTCEIAFHLEQDEKSSIVNVLQKVCQSAGGRVYITGNDTDGETLVYENRHERALRSLAATFNNTMSGVGVTWKSAENITKVRTAIYPVRVDTAATTVLASLADEVAISPGKSYTFNLRVRDPNGNNRISGTALVSPLVSMTDYKISATAGSGGSDLNSQMTIGTPSGTNTISVTITNPLTVAAYVNFLQVRGKGIYPFDVLDHITGSGDRALTYEMPYCSDFGFGRDYSTYLHGRFSQSLPNVKDVWFYAEANSTFMGYLMGGVAIGSRILLQEGATGLNAEFFVDQIMVDIMGNGSQIKVMYMVSPAESAQWFILDDTDYGVLDDTSIVLAI